MKNQQQDIFSDYFEMTYHISSCQELNSSEKIVYSMLASLVNNQGYVNITNDTIAKCVGLKPLQISRIINKLTSKGYLKCEDNKSYNRKIYVRIMDFFMTK